MQINIYDTQYDELIKKIKTRKNVVITLTAICLALVLLHTILPGIEILGEKLVDYESMHPALLVLLLFVITFVGVIGQSAATLPLFTSLDNECDPHKHLILNTRIQIQKDMNNIYATDLFYLGDYQQSMGYADAMIAWGKENFVLVGLFAKTRCEYMLGNYGACREYAAEFARKLSTCKKLKPKQIVELNKIHEVIKLICAITEDDTNKINELRASVVVYNASKATECFVNFVKGVAAYKVNDKQEAIYRFKAVTYGGSKTAFADLAKEYLDLLK